MADGGPELEPAQQVAAAGKAFEQEFERFARFTSEVTATELSLDDALAEERAPVRRS